MRYGDAFQEASPSSATRISEISSLAEDRRMMKSVERNGGRKVRPSAKNTGF